MLVGLCNNWIIISDLTNTNVNFVPYEQDFSLFPAISNCLVFLSICYTIFTHLPSESRDMKI